MKRILIFADSRWRDAFACALLQKELGDQGFIVEVVSYDIWNETLSLFKPHAVVLTHLHGKRNRIIADYVKRQGGKVIVVPSEGRPNSQAQTDWFLQQLDDPLLDLYCSWNDLVQHDKSVTTGCPRFEIYDQYRHLIEPKELFCDKYGLDPNKKIILVSSSFPQSKFAYSHINFNQGDWKDLAVDTIRGRENAQSFAERELEFLQKFQLWTSFLMDQHPENQYIVKPHPMEDVALWEQFCDRTGAIIVRQEYIFNALSACDLLIAKIGCITIQEAWLLRKPVMQVLLSNEKTGAAEEAYKISPWNAACIEEMFFNNPETVPSFNKEQEYLQKYGYTIKNSNKKIATAITQLLQNVDVVAEPTVQELKRMYQLLHQHALQNLVPDLTRMHLGKATTQDHIAAWHERL